ncbi:MAG: PHP domain-containing protein [Thermodesulfobacteriota bacterium]|nr:PHP domain-containing protein [Thermodesulfobacteriota bacterium]
MKTRFDLHTHCMEATGDSIPKVETVKKIVKQVKKRGLSGIAVTDHDDKEYGFRVKEIVDQWFPGEVIIIPGQEIHVHREHVVELFLEDDRVFRFCAHPFFGKSFENFLDKEVENIHGIELKNGAWQLLEDRVREVARDYKLILLENSDAHSLKEIGLHYNNMDLADLYNRSEGF